MSAIGAWPETALQRVRPGARARGIAAHPATLLVTALLLILARRPSQLFDPQVWVEEGTKLIPQYLQSGPAFLFEPVNGYLILPAKLISFLALQLSFIHYPAASYALTLAAWLAIVLTIARAPTALAYRPLCALAMLLIPIAPEPYGVGLYIFWPIGLFSVLALLWNFEGRAPWTRAALTLVGGLSSPLGAALAPLFAARALWRRDESDFLALAAALAASLVQLSFYADMPPGITTDWRAVLADWFACSTLIAGAVLVAGAAAATRERPAGRRAQILIGAGAVAAAVLTLLLTPGDAPARLAVERFVGDYFLNLDSAASLVVGAAATAFLLILTALRTRARDEVPLLLIGAFCAGVGLSLLRVHLGTLDAVAAGNRYFFYPFVTLSWLLLYFFKHAPAMRPVLGAMLVAPIINASSAFATTHEHLDWSGRARACVRGDPFVAPMLDYRRWPTFLAELPAEIASNSGFEPDALNPLVKMPPGPPHYWTTAHDDWASGVMTLRAAPPPGARAIVLRLVTGSDAAGQSVTITNRKGDVIARADLENLVSQWDTWGYLVVPVAAEESEMTIAVADEGAGLGRWVAIDADQYVVAAGTGFPERMYQFPVHYSGRSNLRWNFALKPEECARLAQRSLFDGVFGQP